MSEAESHLDEAHPERLMPGRDEMLFVIFGPLSSTAIRNVNHWSRRFGIQADAVHVQNLLFNPFHHELVPEYTPVEPGSEEETEILEKPKKETKVSTYEQTLMMFEEGKTIKEIANIRQLTTNTINNHLAKLIKDEKIELNQVLSEERINELTNYFEGYEEESLTPLKEKLGDKVTWDELKLYRASKMR
jgi:uncharacterized protein YpbB